MEQTLLNLSIHCRHPVYNYIHARIAFMFKNTSIKICKLYKKPISCLPHFHDCINEYNLYYYNVRVYIHI